MRALFATIGVLSLLTNGEFKEWKNELPVGWVVAVGATSDGDQTSELKELGAGGGLLLRGGASTGKWRLASQSVAVQSGAYYELTWESRALGLAQDGQQFRNHHVAFIFQDAAGKDVQSFFRDIDEGETRWDGVVARAPEGAVRAVVRVFLSMSGSLEVARVSLTQLEATDSFAILGAHMGRYYSYFEHHKFDWEKARARYEKKAAAAKDAAEFIAVVKEMLAPLDDLHIWLRAPDGSTHATHTSHPARNIDIAVTSKLLTDVRQIGKIAFAGKTAEGFGYLCVGSLAGENALFDEIDEALREMKDTPGMIIDLRPCNGGDERRAARIANIFAGERRVYALSKVRTGNKASEFTAPKSRALEPRADLTYRAPVACLIGPGCVSSGEGFAKMMMAIPTCALIGQPTRGASGNPVQLELPNGVTVSHSTWVDMLPDGTITEGKGIPPAIVVDPKAVDDGAPGDPTLAAAIIWLARRQEK